MNHIYWPEGYEPGFTENFVSNEVIVAGLSAAQLWPLLAIASNWPSYYANSANIRFYDNAGPELANNVRFYFETFGFPVEVSQGVLLGTVGQEKRGLMIALMFTTPGWSRIYQVVVCGYSPRRLRRVSPPQIWRVLSLIRCSMAIRIGWTVLSRQPAMLPMQVDSQTRRTRLLLRPI